MGYPILLRPKLHPNHHFRHCICSFRTTTVFQGQS
jgi:hypothetical protein